MNSNERNLLVGVLSLQLEMVSRQQLVSVFQTWLADRSRPLENLLVDRGFISQQQQELVTSMADKYLQLFAADLPQNLSKLSQFSSLTSYLKELNDVELDATVAHCTSEATGAQADSNTDFSAADFDTQEKHGRFRIIRPHAQGGLGEVLVAEDTELHREVAIKKILPKYAGNRDQQHRFVLEAEITGRLEHPGIVPVYSLARSSDGQPFYVMRFIQGDSLKQAIQSFYTKDRAADNPAQFLSGMRRLLKRFIDVCNAVEYAHSRGILHRDLKPANIMLGKHGETLVVDWGLAKTIGKSVTHKDADEGTIVPTSGDSSQTRMGSVVGTLAFMSPEQADGRLDLLDARTDVYSLGATLYVMLTGQEPIERSEQSNMLSQIRTGRVRPVREVNPLVPAPLASICKRAMAVDREQRYASAAELVEEIERWLADEPVLAHRESIVVRSSRWLRRNRTVATSLAVAIVLGMISAVAFSLVTTRQNVNLRLARDAEARQRQQLSSFALQLLSNAERDLVDVPEAERFQRKQMDLAFQSLQQVANTTNASNDLRRSYAIACRVSGFLAARNLNAEEGERRLKESVAIQQALPPREGANEYRDDLCDTLRDLAIIQRALGNLEEANRTVQQAVKVATELMETDPSNPTYQRSAAIAQFTYAGLLYDLKKSDLARPPATFAYTTLRDLSQGSDAKDTDDNFAILSAALLGRTLYDLDEHQLAREQFDSALAFIQPLKTKHADHRRERFAMTRIMAAVVDLDVKSKQVSPRTHELLGELKASFQSLRKFKNRTYSLFEADAERLAGKVQLAEGNTAEALTSLNGAYLKVNELIKQMESISGSPEFIQIMTAVLADQIACRQALNEAAAVTKIREQAAALLDKARARFGQCKRMLDDLESLTAD